MNAEVDRARKNCMWIAERPPLSDDLVDESPWWRVWRRLGDSALTWWFVAGHDARRTGLQVDGPGGR